MPSTYTSSLRLTLPADGELIGTWGQVVNNGITTLEESAIAGTSSIAMADANRTLTTANGATDEARNMVITLTGAHTAQRDLIVPAVSKIYFIRNDTTGGFGVQVKTAAGTGVVVPASTAMLVYCNGTNVLTAITSLVGTGQFLAGDGTVALPGYAFLLDTNTGMYRASADEIDFACGGVQRFVIATASVQVRPTTIASSPSLVIGAGTNAAGPGYGIDITGSGQATDYARIRLLNNAYSIERLMIASDSAGAYMHTPGALPLVFGTSNTTRMTIAAAGGVSVVGNLSASVQMAAPNFWVGETAGAAGTVGISSSVGASTIYWGNSSAGAGKLDLYTGGGAVLVAPRVASAVNYFQMSQSAAGNGPALAVEGADTNIQWNYYTKGTGQHAFWALSTPQFVIQPTSGSTNYIAASGSAGGNPTLTPTGSGSPLAVRFPGSSIQVIGGARPWSGSVTESQAYLYNVALGICNATASADNKIHEWYKDATSLYGLWISDTGGAAGQWLRVTGGQAAGTTAIDFNTAAAGAINLATGTGGVVITGTATSNGTLSVQDTGAAGVNIRMIGDGGTTPKKFMRVSAGQWQIINDAYNAAPLSLTDAGVMTDIRGLAWGRDPGASASAHAVGSIVLAAIGGYNASALSGSVNAATNNMTVYAMGSGTNATITSGTWRPIGALSSSSNTSLWIRTA